MALAGDIILDLTLFSLRTWDIFPQLCLPVLLLWRLLLAWCREVCFGLIVFLFYRWSSIFLDIIKIAFFFFLPSLLCSFHYNVSNGLLFYLSCLVYIASSNYEFMFSISHFLLVLPLFQSLSLELNERLPFYHPWLLPSLFHIFSPFNSVLLLDNFFIYSSLNPS